MNMREFIPFEKKIWLSSPTMHGEEFASTVVCLWLVTLQH